MLACKNVLRWIGAIVIAVTMAACANEETIEARPLDSGPSQSFAAPYDRTVTAAQLALKSLDFIVSKTSEDERGTIILYHRRVGAATWGDVGRIYIKKTAEPPTMVYVTYQKRIAIDVRGHGEEGFATRYFVLMSKNL